MYDQLISDNDLVKAMNLKQGAGKMLLPTVKFFLKIDRINHIYNELRDLKGQDFFDAALKKLEIEYETETDISQVIPSSGPFIVVANHPLGGIDGIILLKLISEVRPDFRLLGNFLLEQIEPLKDYILPVNPFEDFKSARSSFTGLRNGLKHLKDGHCLGIFPAGEVSSFQLRDMKVTDRVWQTSAVKFIRNAGVQVIPVYFKGSNSSAFYLLGLIHPLLRTARLPSEMLLNRKKKIAIKFRSPVSPKVISRFTSVSSLTHYLRAKTYQGGKSVEIEAFFRSRAMRTNQAPEKIADSAGNTIIETELQNLDKQYHLFKQGNFSVFCAPYERIPFTIGEIGRLREITFREVGEGTNKSSDLDEYDLHYYHLILWDEASKKIAGSYRIGIGKEIISNYGRAGFYISSLFRLKKKFEPFLKESIELGRSFIIKEYQRHPLALALLWKGILMIIENNSFISSIIGPVSISNKYSKKSKSLIVNYLTRNHFDSSMASMCQPRKKFRTGKKLSKANEILLSGIENNLKTLDLCIDELQKGFTVPVLLKKYLSMNGKVIGFNTDPDFNNCLDALVFARIDEVPAIMLSGLKRESGLPASEAGGN